MTRSSLAWLLAALSLAVSSPAAAAPRFTLTLDRPMRAPGNVRLAPGTYDVTFEPAPSGSPHFTAVFHRGGVPVAKAPAELRGAPAGFELSEIPDGWIQASWKNSDARKDGSIHPAKFDFQARSSRAFLEALLTEAEVPAADGSSKAPASVTLAPHVAVPPKTLPKVTPTPAK